MTDKEALAKLEQHFDLYAEVCGTELRRNGTDIQMPAADFVRFVDRVLGEKVDLACEFLADILRFVEAYQEAVA